MTCQLVIVDGAKHLYTYCVYNLCPFVTSHKSINIRIQNKIHAKKKYSSFHCRENGEDQVNTIAAKLDTNMYTNRQITERKRFYSHMIIPISSKTKYHSTQVATSLTTFSKTLS